MIYLICKQYSLLNLSKDKEQFQVNFILFIGLSTILVHGQCNNVISSKFAYILQKLEIFIKKNIKFRWLDEDDDE